MLAEQTVEEPLEALEPVAGHAELVAAVAAARAVFVEESVPDMSSRSCATRARTDSSRSARARARGSRCSGSPRPARSSSGASSPFRTTCASSRSRCSPIVSCSRPRRALPGSARTTSSARRWRARRYRCEHGGARGPSHSGSSPSTASWLFGSTPAAVAGLGFVAAGLGARLWTRVVRGSIELERRLLPGERIEGADVVVELCARHRWALLGGSLVLRQRLGPFEQEVRVLGTRTSMTFRDLHRGRHRLEPLVATLVDPAGSRAGRAPTGGGLRPSRAASYSQCSPPYSPRAARARPAGGALPSGARPGSRSTRARVRARRPRPGRALAQHSPPRPVDGAGAGRRSPRGRHGGLRPRPRGRGRPAGPVELRRGRPGRGARSRSPTCCGGAASRSPAPRRAPRRCGWRRAARLGGGAGHARRCRARPGCNGRPRAYAPASPLGRARELVVVTARPGRAVEACSSSSSQGVPSRSSRSHAETYAGRSRRSDDTALLRAAARGIPVAVVSADIALEVALADRSVGAASA